jgi:hypothetical protein
VLAQISIEGIEHIGDKGIAVAQLIFLLVVIAILSRTAVTLARLWYDAASARNKAENDQTEALNKLRERLESDQEVRRAEKDVLQTLTTGVAQLVTVMGQQRESFEQAARQMKAVSEKRDTQFTALQTSIDGVPDAVWEVGDPKLEAIRSLLEQYLSGMEQRLVEKIDPAARMARQVVTQELKDLRAQVDRQFGVLFARLEDINAALKVLPKSEPVLIQEENEKDDEPILPTT